MQKERKFGEVPDWAKLGPIDLRNYPYRAEQHCRLKSPGREGFHPTIKRGTKECGLWERYFQKHLGGSPTAMRMLMDSSIQEMTVPEQLPQWFDASFAP